MGYALPEFCAMFAKASESAGYTIPRDVMPTTLSTGTVDGLNQIKRTCVAGAHRIGRPAKPGAMVPPAGMAWGMIPGLQASGILDTPVTRL